MNAHSTASCPRWPGALALLGCLGLVQCGRSVGGTVEASSAVYVRTDSNATRIVSPRFTAAGVVGERLAIDAAYTIDAWTGASVDVVTAATPAIRETRHELTTGLGYLGDRVSVAGSYRGSIEPDYRSHGGVLRSALSLADDNTTLALTVFGGHDRVGRAGDPFFARPQWNLGARFTLTQVLGKRTIGELGWETTRIEGFQASPYRWVAIGGDGTCAGAAPWCVPESAPNERLRHAATIRARQALGRRVSLGGEYRLYFDSWGVWSHALEPDLAWLVGDDDTLSLRYRYYTQSEARFYQPRYFELDDADYVTRDRKLSALYTHELGAAYLHVFRVPARGLTISAGVRVTGTYLRYLAFVGLERVGALATTALLGVKF
ncbi:DUF3570 domain-containing protein [Nannocystaceae bacterium ST9]